LIGLALDDPHGASNHEGNSMDLGIQGKRALVLASSRGIGLAIAHALANEGASVILVGRNAERLTAAVAAINALKRGVASAVTTDLAKSADIDALIAAVDRQAGGIDILVNSTGGPPAKPATAVTVEELRSQFEVMVASVIRISSHFLPGMRERNWGRILTVASSGVLQPIPNLALSNALRMSLVGWSKTLAAEVAADGVTVNVVVPGRIHTERVNEIAQLAAKTTGKSIELIVQESKASIPAGRYGTVEEFGAVAAFLAGVPASYVTGSILRVDGGYIRSI
jgi:3-oxoacyl-[acyl-carrier protein] reductase